VDARRPAAAAVGGGLRELLLLTDPDA